MSLLDLDNRWRRLQELGGPLDIGFEEPEAWPHGERGEAPVLEAGEDRLSADLCRLGERRFLRCILRIGIEGSDGEAALIAPWAEVNHETFYAYVAHAFEGAPAPAASEALLANALPRIDLGSSIVLEFDGAETRPFAKISAFAAPLPFDALLDLYAELDHDLRPMLSGKEPPAK